jgi:hypothetical protein
MIVYFVYIAVVAFLWRRDNAAIPAKATAESRA